ncbi:hypothetical protein LPJ53_001412 [Coemansia erecta]|uniref:Uncharacterized protein n=1 Tax=Coemansia erecta TaxID=147472 RepID=A0A9W8CSW0_9FUNG|nr:hypothetical protein LPJ53_001412 [Coemansia erecta]
MANKPTSGLPDLTKCVSDPSRKQGFACQMCGMKVQDDATGQPDLTRYLSRPSDKPGFLCQLCGMRVQDGATHLKHIMDGTCQKRKSDQRLGLW